MKVLDGNSKVGSAKVYSTQKEMDQEKLLKDCIEFIEEITDRINPSDENLARFHYYGKTLLKELKK